MLGSRQPGGGEPGLPRNQRLWFGARLTDPQPGTQGSAYLLDSSSSSLGVVRLRPLRLPLTCCGGEGARVRRAEGSASSSCSAAAREGRGSEAAETRMQLGPRRAPAAADCAGAARSSAPGSRAPRAYRPRTPGRL